jgi:hypothetical protein
MPTMTSPEVRSQLVESLRLDLVGPWPGHAFERELLPENPTRWYLTGYLVPEDAPVEHKTNAEANGTLVLPLARRRPHLPSQTQRRPRGGESWQAKPHPPQNLQKRRMQVERRYRLVRFNG